MESRRACLARIQKQECRECQKMFRRQGGIEILKDNMQNGEVDQSGNATTFILATLDCL